jgi:hypothetical protein
VSKAGQNRDAIFVQIPAYRDSELVNTLDSLFDRAAHPHRLHVCICWQHAAGERIPARLRKLQNVEIIDVNYRLSRGANWARRCVQKRWRGERFSLIIDSHLRFVSRWDARIIELFLGLKAKGVERPVITCYPPKFDPASFPRGRSYAPLKIYKEAYHGGLLVHFGGHQLPFWRWLREPITAQFLALGMLFAEGEFNADVPYDPNIYFFGDEITTGLRAYCHGYDFFHPHRVLAWHAYDRTTRTCHWQDHRDWRKTDVASLDRVRQIFMGRHFNGYTLGSKRSVADYERYIGMPLILREGYR